MLRDLKNEDFITKYLAYTSGGEVPTFFNRWACIVALGAWARQDVWLPFGSSKIFPNTYAMLLGAAGTRKSTAIKQVKRLIEKVGYTDFAPKRVSKEKYLEDLAALNNESQAPGDRVDQVLWGTLTSDIGTTSNFIAADEFNEFFSNNILDFVSMLGDMWDFEGIHETRTKSSAPIKIPNPNISILGGNTTETFCKTFPPEIIGQGFFSRVLFVYAEPNGKKIAFPEAPNEDDTEFLLDELRSIKESFQGEVNLLPEAKTLLERIYHNFKGIDDSRFASYSNRRFTHLIKLTLIHAMADKSGGEIRPIHVIRANTILTQTEHYMPMALGEFGAAKNSAAAHKVLKVIQGQHKALSLEEVWAKIPGTLDKLEELAVIIKNLVSSNKIILTDKGILAKHSVLIEKQADWFDWNYLTAEERNLT